MKAFSGLSTVVHGNLKFFKFSAILLCIFFIISLNAQSPKIDSLKREIERQSEDTTKVDALNELSRSLMGVSLPDAIQIAEQASNLAKKLNYQKGNALALKNIGLGYYYQSDYLNVFEYWEGSLVIFKEINDQAGVANLESNLGSIYFDQGDDARAVEYFLRSIKAAESIHDSTGIGRALIGLGNVYLNKDETLDKAKEYLWRAMPIFKRTKYNDGIGICELNLGNIYLKQSRFDSALIYLSHSLEVFDNKVYVPSVLNKIGQLYREQGDYIKAIEYLEKSIHQATELNLKMEVAQALLGIAETHQNTKDFDKAMKAYGEVESISKEIGLNYELKDTYDGMAHTSAEMGDFNSAYKYFVLYDRIKDTLYSLETDDKIKGMQFTYQIEKKQSEVDGLIKDKKLQDLEIIRQQQAKNSYLAGAILLLLIAFITYRNYRRKVKTNQLLDIQNEEIEKLLLNILPAETAKELQNDGYATPRSYESVSVLFTDFKDFTKIAEGLKPHELVAELNSFFHAFDDIIDQHHLEKIKTIGDAYMCAGGIPISNATHPIRIVKAGIAIQKYMKAKNEQRTKKNMPIWELRVGIHTGPVVAGVVGKKKYAYDIWGDTVNIASRMESNGEVGRVNISSATFDLIKDHFECTYRGKIEAKNKGFIDMYFLESEKGNSFVIN